MSFYSRLFKKNTSILEDVYTKHASQSTFYTNQILNFNPVPNTARYPRPHPKPNPYIFHKIAPGGIVASGAYYIGGLFENMCECEPTIGHAFVQIL